MYVPGWGPDVVHPDVVWVIKNHIHKHNTVVKLKKPHKEEVGVLEEAEAAYYVDMST